MTAALKEKLVGIYDRMDELAVRKAFIDRTLDVMFVGVTTVAYQSRTGMVLEVNERNFTHFVWIGYLITIDHPTYLPGEWK